MSLGLALQREKQSKFAAAAFDSAMVYLAPAERARLDRLERVLPASDSARRANGAAPASAAVGNLYWLLADPLWSREGNESRIEFLARLTYAELRWTVDELKVRGADTDRGDIFVRYGPPDLIAVFGPAVSSSSYNAIEDMNVSTVWAYPTGLIFVFNGAPTFATAHTAKSDVAMVGAIKQSLPVRWDNLTSMRVDSMLTQIVRFRGGRDSVDLFVALEPPVDSIRAASAAGAKIRGDVWFLAGNMSTAFRDSLTLTEPGVRNWSKRVSPDLYIVRGEASADGSTRGGRATAVVDTRDNGTTGVAQKGFGISDLLLSTSAEPRTGVEKRWTDLAITPAVGALHQNGQLALVWENYEFGQRDGSAKYQVVITLKRERTLTGQIAANVVGALAGIARVDHGSDHVGVTFDRTPSYSPAFVDHLTMSLGETPAGTYTLTLQITDQVTGKVVARTKTIRIRA
jgi:GWxTD domain-containing protein